MAFVRFFCLRRSGGFYAKEWQFGFQTPHSMEGNKHEKRIIKSFLLALYLVQDVWNVPLSLLSDNHNPMRGQVRVIVGNLVV